MRNQWTPQDNDAGAKPVADEVSEGDESGRSGRLLLCDDSATERTALARLLRDRGYEVDEAADGSAALLVLRGSRRPYDLLLLDLQMPGTDGFDVLAYIQEHRPDLPVVLLSGLPPDQIGEGIARLPGAHLPPLLLKPIESEQLLQVIELKLMGELP
jgi:CheY-like chemotaxis protein